MKDKTIICIQCEESFIFSVSEQKRFEKQGFDDHKRCPNCRKKKMKASESNDEPKKRKGKKLHSTRNYYDLDYE